MKVDRIRRRTFLQGSGIALAVPFLPSLFRASDAEAAAATKLKRLIAITTHYGRVDHQWFPADASRTLQPLGSRGARAMPMSALAGDASPLFDRATYGSIFGKMILLDGIDAVYSSGHQKSYPLTGYVKEGAISSYESIDQIIAKKAQIYPSEPIFRSLNIASGPVGNTYEGPSVSFTRTGAGMAYVPTINDPETLHDLAFKNVIQGPNASAEFDVIKSRKLSVIDRVLQDYQRAKMSSRLSKADQLKLEAYAQYLREFEKSVRAQSPVTCTVPPKPPVMGKAWSDTARAEALVDSIIHLVRCGLTNVVTLNLDPNSAAFKELVLVDDHHNLSHQKEDGGAKGQSAIDSELKVGKFQLGVVAKLLKGIDVTEDAGAGRTFLDNALVFWGNDMGSTANHKGQRIPTALFGGKGVLKQDLLVDYRSSNVYTYKKTLNPDGSPKRERVGVSYNNVLMTVCQAFGLPPAEYEQGQAGIGDYTPSSYFYGVFPSQGAYEQFAFGDRKTPLTEILA